MHVYYNDTCLYKIYVLSYVLIISLYLEREERLRRSERTHRAAGTVEVQLRNTVITVKSSTHHTYLSATQRIIFFLF